MFAPRHRAVLAILALLPLGVTGCRALGVSKPPAPQALAPAPSLLVTETVQRHNRNAERVGSAELGPVVRRVREDSGSNQDNGELRHG